MVRSIPVIKMADCYESVTLSYTMGRKIMVESGKIVARFQKRYKEISAKSWSNNMGSYQSNFNWCLFSVMMNV